MSPIVFLALIITVTAWASAANVLQRRRWRKKLAKLSSELHMAYSHDDRFGLADRVAEHFPIPGVASLRVIDLLYASEGKGYRYLFSAEYTNGVIRSKYRILRAVTFVESRGASDAAVWSTLTLAPDNLPLIEQYRHLANHHAPPSTAGS
ncbi:MAG: hypothetical protein JO353_04585 [Phycisphaerae bacterium]|nr:hypothetical protein [Phycisphaerae bacterium]